MCGRRAITAVGLALLALGAIADSEDSGSGQISGNKSDLVPTYRTEVEKILQKIGNIVTPSSRNSSGSSENRTRLGKLVGSLIPTSVEKATAKGFGQILNGFEKHFHAIFPGTLWCGGGNIASSESDVGLFERTDACCRAHDNCPLNMDAGEIKDTLWNNGIFTRSACFCDEEFYNCLKNVSTIVSNNIGKTYFNILRPQCFSYDYPIEYCDEYEKHLIGDNKCIEYQLDNKQPKKLQWFDRPDF